MVCKFPLSANSRKPIATKKITEPVSNRMDVNELSASSGRTKDMEKPHLFYGPLKPFLPFKERALFKFDNKISAVCVK
jgi:hypothetical protein